jgi:hypothetical protein
MTPAERYEALDKFVKRLEEGLVVEATLAGRYRDRHEQWLQDHQAAMEAHNRAMQEHDRRMIALDEKLDRIADMLGFRGGNGSK